MIFIMIFEKKSEEIVYFFILCKRMFYCKKLVGVVIRELFF